MRISDWSSDVCSSDLSRRPSRPALDNQAAEARQAPTVEKPSKLGRQPQRLAEAPLEEQPVLDAARSSAAPEPGFGRTEGRTATLTAESPPTPAENQGTNAPTAGRDLLTPLWGLPSRLPN